MFSYCLPLFWNPGHFAEYYIGTIEIYIAFILHIKLYVYIICTNTKMSSAWVILAWHNIV